MDKKKVPVSVMLPEEIDQKLRSLALASNRSRSAYIRQILRKYIRYTETKDNPEAEPVNWDMDQWMHTVPTGVPEEKQDK